MIGITRSYVDVLRKGDRRPGMRTAHAIEKLSDGDIRMQDWIDLNVGMES